MGGGGRGEGVEHTITGDMHILNQSMLRAMLEAGGRIYIIIYYMAVSHKDWELPNSRI